MTRLRPAIVASLGSRRVGETEAAKTANEGRANSKHQEQVLHGGSSDKAGCRFEGRNSRIQLVEERSKVAGQRQVSQPTAVGGWDPQWHAAVDLQAFDSILPCALCCGASKHWMELGSRFLLLPEWKLQLPRTLGCRVQSLFIGQLDAFPPSHLMITSLIRITHAWDAHYQLLLSILFWHFVLAF